MAKSVRLSNGRYWPTRTEARAHFKAMLHRYADGDRVTDSADESDLRALLSYYDSVIPLGNETKTGSGIDYFFKQRNSSVGYSTSGFHVHRTDGTSIDFSVYRAIETETPSQS